MTPRSFAQGLAFTFREGYVSAAGVGLEAGGLAIGGYLAYEFASWQP